MFRSCCTLDPWRSATRRPAYDEEQRGEDSAGENTEEYVAEIGERRAALTDERERDGDADDVAARAPAWLIAEPTPKSRGASPATAARDSTENDMPAPAPCNSNPGSYVPA